MWSTQVFAIEEYCKKKQSVHFASCAFNNTFVLGVDHPRTHSSAVIHTDQQGKMLYQQIYPQSIQNKVQMLGNQELVVLCTKRSTLVITDLETHQVLKVPLNLQSRKEWKGELWIFPETKHILIQQVKGHYYENRQFILRYYDYNELRKGNYSPISMFRQTLKYSVSKPVDHYSKIGFFTDVWMQYPKLIYFSLKDNPKKELKTIEVTDFIEQQTKPQIYQVRKYQQFKPNVYMCMIAVDQIKKDHNFSYIALYIIDASHGEQQATMKKLQLSCSFKDETRFFVSKNTSVILKSHTICAEIIISKLLTISNDTLEILSSFQFMNHIDDLIMNFDRSNIITKILKNPVQKGYFIIVNQLILEYSMKQVSIFFLLHLNEDFDDDLLQDSIELLE